MVKNFPNLVEDRTFKSYKKFSELLVNMKKPNNVKKKTKTTRKQSEKNDTLNTGKQLCEYVSLVLYIQKNGSSRMKAKYITNKLKL